MAATQEKKRREGSPVEGMAEAISSAMPHLNAAEACPVTGERVSLEVDRNGVRELRPAGAVVSMVIPDGPFGYDVIESSCHRVLFFATEQAGARWAAEHEGTTLLSVQDAFELGRAMSWRLAPDIFGARAELVQARTRGEC